MTYKVYDVISVNGVETYPMENEANFAAEQYRQQGWTTTVSTRVIKRGGNIKANERQYVALTHYENDVWTHKARNFITTIGGKGTSKDSIESLARNMIPAIATSDIMADTMQKNLFVISLSACKKAYRQAYEDWLDQE